MITVLKIIEVLMFIFSGVSAFGFVYCVIKGVTAKSQLSAHQARNSGVKIMNQLIISLVIALVIYHYI
ncbi:hypothetical protein [Salmonella enterica]|uniref:Uncharacterized protein n=2 Tax=Salmonella enterica I TaxID=59201 RepID=A0A659MHV0_SALET|nr:hypothetical protein [Salmonella enterica]TGC36864.1 hypothetical protein C9F01_04585 [Salmonella enterica subsp. enterica serovar Wernigerode]TGC38546.1 hypothetical protein C9E93_15900 [Salmonella enterica subsp. enterica serovar Wernigerode]TGC97695.1 hypothetical protein C9F05_14360 [Salmonella enterica subsp. enterica serovar Wernigerode]